MPDVPELPLDPETAERLLSGQIAPDDAPPGYAEVAALVRAAHRRPAEGEIPGEEYAVDLMMRAMAEARLRVPATRVRRSIRQVVRANVAALTTAAVLVSTTSLAAAGVLPRQAQVVVSRVLGTVGLDVPNPDEQATTLATGDEGSGRTPRRAAPPPADAGGSPAVAAAPSSSTTSAPSSSTTTTSTTMAPAPNAAEECVSLDETTSSTTTTTTQPDDGSTTTTEPDESTTTTTSSTTTTTTTTVPPDGDDGSTTTTTEPDPIAEAQETACPSGEEGDEGDGEADGDGDGSQATSTDSSTTTTTAPDGSTSSSGSTTPPSHSHAIFYRSESALATDEEAETPPP